MFLIKSMDKIYKESFMKGSLYFKAIEDYRSIEDDKVGDKLEGAIEKRLNKEQGYDIYIDDIYGGNAESIGLNLTPTLSIPIKISCFSYVDENYVIRKDNTINIKKEYFYELEQFNGDRCVLLCTNVDEFINRIRKAINKKNIAIKASKVYYYDDHPLFEDVKKLNEKTDEELFDLAYKSMFYKQQKYYKQKEWRIVTKNLHDNFIEVGDLGDIFIDITQELN
ncbi:hypothetical protein IR133_06005 [Staphylococcus saprophyticus]|uniref:hypothetical protein n=1 Tax=Staphylococcus xylosus TaxID=1288 RepID=UPI0010740EAF|nr:hypothetical protein [Staphylococcus xylosus]MBF0813263.1 hypothetical protein [Staphylococcus saprophyticus]